MCIVGTGLAGAAASIDLGMVDQNVSDEYLDEDIQEDEDNIELRGVSVKWEDDTIYLKGVSAKSFESIMYYMYPCRSLGYRSIWNLSEEEEFDVLNTAEVFQVAGLKELVKSLMNGNNTTVMY